jgi:hypothetical protein
MVDPEPGRHRHRRSRVERCMVNGHVVCSVVQDGDRLSWIEDWQVNRSPRVTAAQDALLLL